MSEDREIGRVSKGFAGLTSLLSDDASVDTRRTPASEGAAQQSSALASPPLATRSQSTRQHSPSPDHSSNGGQLSQRSSGGSEGKWVLGLGVAAAVIWGLFQTGDKARSNGDPSSQVSTAPPTISSRPAYTPTPPSPAPKLVEEMPGPGSGDVLGANKLRYCLAEDIRLTAAKQAVNDYNSDDVDRFNAMVADFNSRCSNFRYRRGALESARSEVEMFRTA